MKPCPFCGCEKIVRSIDPGCQPDWPNEIDRKLLEIGPKTPTTVTFYCDNCGAQVQGWAWQLEVAIGNAEIAWNHRAKED